MEESNKESNSGSKKKKRFEGHQLDLVASAATATHTKKRIELLTTAEEIRVWDLLSDGMTQTAVAKELGIHIGVVGKRINSALERIRGWEGRQAEDWRNKQLLIIAKQIAATVLDTAINPAPMLNEEGEQMFTRAGTPIWLMSPSQAAKARNTARNTLISLLKQESDLLSLSVSKSEITVDKKVAIGIYNFNTDDPDSPSMDDI